MKSQPSRFLKLKPRNPCASLGTLVESATPVVGAPTTMSIIPRKSLVISMPGVWKISMREKPVEGIVRGPK